jgi:hypothetical protein
VVGVSGPKLIGYALVLSAVLAWLHPRGAAASAAGALTACALLLIFDIWPAPRKTVSNRGFQLWALLVIIPTAVVWAVSSLGLLSTNPWLLMILGPMSFAIALLMTMISYNIIANRQQTDRE